MTIPAGAFRCAAESLLRDEPVLEQYDDGAGAVGGVRSRQR